jgi:L-rhamnose mutarotase
MIPAMEYTALKGRLLPDGVAGYREAHDNIPPAVLDAQRAAGVRRWLIFQDGLDLLHVAECEDFEVAMRRLAESDVDRRWQQQVAPFKQAVDEQGNTERRLELIYSKSLWLPAS